MVSSTLSVDSSRTHFRSPVTHPPRSRLQIAGVAIDSPASLPAGVQGTAKQEEGEGEEQAKRLLAAVVDQLARWKGADWRTPLGDVSRVPCSSRSGR